MQAKTFVYGPLKSRRRGLSLGIDLFPGAKVCSFDCVYCFRGPTLIKVLALRDPGLPTSQELEEELRRALSEAGEVEAVDFSGNGEPTLHSRLSEFAEVVRRVVEELCPRASVGIFTNSSTLGLKSVAQALSELDHVEAKLDAVDEQKFQAINRPAGGVKVRDILRALRSFRREFSGTLAVQVMLVSYSGLQNYTPIDAEAMAEALRVVEPDEVHLYTAYRMPWASSVTSAPRERMMEFAEVLEEQGLRVKVYPE